LQILSCIENKKFQGFSKWPSKGVNSPWPFSYGWGELAPLLVPPSHSRGVCNKKVPYFELCLGHLIANTNSEYANFITGGK